MTEPPSAKEELTARVPLGGSLSGSLIEESPRSGLLFSPASGPLACGSGPLSSLSDPKPEKRIVDGTAEPLDYEPINENYCAACELFTVTWHCHHIVGRAQGGDDVPENLVWLCASCHRILHDFPVNSLAARRLVRYCREMVPELGAYADKKKFLGYVEWRYIGPEHDLEPVA